MSGLTAKELAAMRTVSDDFFPDTCTIQSISISAGATGSVERSYVTGYTDVPCRLENDRSGDESVNNLAVTDEPTYMLNVPYTQEVLATDRVIVSGVTYAVENVQINHSYDMVNRAKVRPI